MNSSLYMTAVFYLLFNVYWCDDMNKFTLNNSNKTGRKSEIKIDFKGSLFYFRSKHVLKRMRRKAITNHLQYMKSTILRDKKGTVIKPFFVKVLKKDSYNKYG